jgi:hypothetical protein
MDERILSDETAPRHVERQSKSEIARQLALDRKTVRTILGTAGGPPARTLPGPWAPPRVK